MFKLFKQHDILELPSIPREKDKLRAVVGEARSVRKRHNLIQFASFNLIGWAVFILGSWMWPSAEANSVAVSQLFTIYLPTIIR